MSNKRKTIADLRSSQAAEDPEEELQETPETTDPAAVEEAAPAVEEAAPEASVTTDPSAAPAMVSISATELATLRADAAQWTANSGRFQVLEKWYGNMKEAGAVPEKDASDNTSKTTSKATQRAIDIKNSRK